MSAAPETALKPDKGTADSLNNHVTETHSLTRSLWSTAERSGSARDVFLTSASFTALWVPSTPRCSETKNTARCCRRRIIPDVFAVPAQVKKQTHCSANNITAAAVCRCVQMWQHQRNCVQFKGAAGGELSHQRPDTGRVNRAQHNLFFEGNIKAVILKISVLFPEFWRLNSLHEQLLCQKQQRSYWWQIQGTSCDCFTIRATLCFTTSTCCVSLLFWRGSCSSRNAFVVSLCSSVQVSEQ